jgi:hemerythrin
MVNQFITWKKEWETGISKIDSQHKHFIEIVNKTYLLNEEKKQKETLNLILKDLIEYVRVHFSTEEEYFKKTNYPYKEEHEEKHQELLGNVLDFSKRFDRGEDFPMVVKELLNFLKKWLDEHLIRFDHKYVPWLKEHGIR